MSNPSPIEQVLVGMYPRQRRELDHYAKAIGFTRSELLRKLIDRYIEFKQQDLPDSSGPPFPFEDL